MDNNQGSTEQPPCPQCGMGLFAWMAQGPEGAQDELMEHLATVDPTYVDWVQVGWMCPACNWRERFPEPDAGGLHRAG